MKNIFSYYYEQASLGTLVFYLHLKVDYNRTDKRTKEFITELLSLKKPDFYIKQIGTLARGSLALFDEQTFYTFKFGDTYNFLFKFSFNENQPLHLSSFHNKEEKYVFILENGLASIDLSLKEFTFQQGIEAKKKFDIFYTKIMTL